MSELIFLGLGIIIGGSIATIFWSTSTILVKSDLEHEIFELKEEVKTMRKRIETKCN